MTRKEDPVASWKKLNLSSTFAHPPINTWAVLRVVPKTGLRTDVRHDIGYLQPDPHTGHKLWWYGTRGREDLACLKKDHDIWWCLMPPFDAVRTKRKEGQQR